jgi:hypothetical protein
MTQATIDFLYKKADTEEKKHAVKSVERDWENYEYYITRLKELKKDYNKQKGYRSSSERESYQKMSMRAEEAIKSLKPYLQTVMSNKNNPLIYYYILSNPAREWDYYRGTTHKAIPFSSSLWKRKYLINLFK